MIGKAYFREYWQWLKRRLWIRPALYCLGALSILWLAGVADRFLQDGALFKVSGDTIKDLLGIIASSMLAVTIFAVSVMNAAYSSAINATTPRAFEVMVADNSTKTALSSFVGAFIFAVVGITGLNMGYFGDNGRAIIFIMTMGLFIWVIATFVYWIDYVTRLGQMRQTVERIGASAESTLANYLRHPVGKATPVEAGTAPPDGAHAISSGEGGVVKSLSVSQLIDLCDENGLEMDVAIVPGTPVGRDTVLCFVSGDHPDDELVAKIRQSFVIGYERDPEQDPELALRLLAEVADRALSPGVNDPGTASDVLDTLGRVFAKAFGSAENAEKPETDPRVRMPLIDPDIFVRAAYETIARDGASHVEVASRLQQSLHAVSKSVAPEFRDALRQQADRALKRAEDELHFEWEKERVRTAADWSN